MHLHVTDLDPYLPSLPSLSSPSPPPPSSESVIYTNLDRIYYDHRCHYYRAHVLRLHLVCNLHQTGSVSAIMIIIVVVVVHRRRHHDHDFVFLHHLYFVYGLDFSIGDKFANNKIIIICAKSLA